MNAGAIDEQYALAAGALKHAIEVLCATRACVSEATYTSIRDTTFVNEGGNRVHFAAHYTAGVKLCTAGCPICAQLNGFKYRCRSVWKLVDILNHFPMMKRQGTFLDLCAAPGSWSQYLVELGLQGVAVTRRTRHHSEKMAPITHVKVVLDDVLEPRTDFLIGLDYKFDLVVADGGIDKGVDPEMSHLPLLWKECHIGLRCLEVRGSMIVKLMGVANIQTLRVVQSIGMHFANVELFKPRSSRITSTECYAIFLRRRGDLTLGEAADLERQENFMKTSAMAHMYEADAAMDILSQRIADQMQGANPSTVGNVEAKK